MKTELVLVVAMALAGCEDKQTAPTAQPAHA